MSTPNTRKTDLKSYRSQLNTACDGDIMLWKTLKAFAQALLISAVGYIAVKNGADPYPTAATVIAAALVVFVGERKELEIASLVTLTLSPISGSGSDDGGGDDE
jgi:hypothetical protein